MIDCEIEPEPIPPKVTFGIEKIYRRPTRPSFGMTIVNGARIGFRLVTYVILPLSLLLLLVGLIPTAFGFGARRSLGVHSLAIAAVGMYLGLAALGLFYGAIFGLIAAIFRWARGQSGSESWWAKANRPIRLGRKEKSEPIGADMTSVADRSRWRRQALCWMVAIYAVSAFLILTIASEAGIYTGKFVKRRLSAAMASADRDDPNWRIDDLMAARDVVPDTENGAIVVARVVAMISKNWPGPPTTLPGRPNPPPSEVQLAYDKLEAAESDVRLDDETAATLLEGLRREDEAVNLARTVANFARGRHEIDLQPSLIDTLLGETQNSRIVARLLVADAAIRAHDGDIDGALDSCRAILSVGRSIGDEPFLISGLVRIAIGGVATKAARRALAQGEPSDAALAKLQAMLLDELTYPLLLRGIRGERAMMDEMIRRIADGEQPIDSLSGNPPPGEKIPPVAPWGKLMFDHQRAVGLEWMQMLIDIAKQPPHRQAAMVQAWEAELQRVRRSPLGMYGATIPFLMMPTMKAAAQANSRYQADLGATAILLACERHRRRSGDWPKSIADIEPTILAVPPVDPFTGNPFVMERVEEKLLIHSIGPNLRDEHGHFLPKLWATGIADDVGTGAWDVPLRKRVVDPE